MSADVASLLGSTTYWRACEEPVKTRTEIETLRILSGRSFKTRRVPIVKQRWSQSWERNTKILP